MHLIVALSVPFLRFRLKCFGGFLDLRFLRLVTFYGLGVVVPFAGWCEFDSQLGQVLPAAFGLVVIPLIGSLGLLDRGVILVHAGIGLRCTALVGKQRAQRSK